jgi:hypothetical protein
MTFLEIQNRLMDRLNLSSDDARARLKDMINERVRKTQTSCKLGPVRRALITFNTAIGVSDYALEDFADEDLKIILPQTIRIPSLNRVLGSASVDSQRVIDPGENFTGAPTTYSIYTVNADSMTIKLSPTPDAAYTMAVDGIRNGVDLIDDDDEPAIPEDFHDALLYGVAADENAHWDKAANDNYFEKKYEKRCGEMRYFISRQIYLHRIQNGMSFDFSSNKWWWLYGSPIVA